MCVKPLIVVVLVFAVSALATRLHVNSGCILVDGEPLCANNHRKLGSHAKVEAKFSGSKNRPKDIVGCLKYFDWPAQYGDVYFGKDDCLYDSKGTNINGQCCYNRGGYEARNPYRS